MGAIKVHPDLAILFPIDDPIQLKEMEMEFAKVRESRLLVDFVWPSGPIDSIA